MQQRLSGFLRPLSRACQLHATCDATKAVSVGTESHLRCSCGTHQVCIFHGSALAWANPDNKPPPSGKDKHDSDNTKHDGLERDPDDSPDYAPGYYDGKKGGHRKVASQEQSDQVPDSRPGGEQASRPGGEPKDWHPEQAEDPNQPQPEDPHKADVPDMQSSIKGQRAELAPESAADKQNPNRDPPVGEDTQVGSGQMPNQETKLAGMPEARAPPQQPETSGAPLDQQAGSTDTTSPFGDPASLEDFDQPGKRLAEEGRVKEGQV